MTLRQYQMNETVFSGELFEKLEQISKSCYFIPVVRLPIYEDVGTYRIDGECDPISRYPKYQEWERTPIGGWTRIH